MQHLEVTQLSRQTRDDSTFNNVSFRLSHGEFGSLLGPSGGGKSCLLHCIAGLKNADSGSISLSGEEISSLPVQRRELAFLFQQATLFPNMTVAENIAFGLKMRQVEPATQQQRVQDAIQMLQLKGYEQQAPHQLTPGLQQRVALARALVTQPKLLLLDEPLIGLDSHERRELGALIRDIQQQQGLTTLYVTHDQQEALTLSDRIFIMQDGQIIQHGTAEEIYSQPANPFVANFVGHHNLLSPAQARRLLDIETEHQLAIRPEAIYVHDPDRDYASHISHSIDAVVLSSVLLGNVIRYRVTIAGCELTVDQLNRSSERMVGRGSTLPLRFNLAEIKALT